MIKQRKYKEPPCVLYYYTTASQLSLTVIIPVSKIILQVYFIPYNTRLQGLHTAFAINSYIR